MITALWSRSIPSLRIAKNLWEIKKRQNCFVFTKDSASASRRALLTYSVGSAAFTIVQSDFRILIQARKYLQVNSNNKQIEETWFYCFKALFLRDFSKS